MDGFETGIVLLYTVHSRIHSNEVRNIGTAVKPGSANGILVAASSFNEVSENFSHDNGHMGIGISGGAGNIIRANRLLNNQTQYRSSCSMMLYSGTIGNQVVGNEVIDTLGVGIMLGSSPTSTTTQNLIAENQIQGHEYAGIQVRTNSQLNTILQNVATGNNTSGEESDLADWNTTSTNLWIRNVGTCAPGNDGCN